ncbi:RodZ domain-containing protein [Streptomyces sp. NPDC006512]|uniref:RodZ domain-containing protein n=1 Tax=Streptomyces sp. NPDC006512 TaxID=3154307 RepID=UPI0033AB456C
MGFGTGLPERIGAYAVERELGAGGMGTVYLARSRGGRAVAVKVVRPELAADPHFRERFRAEVAAARKVGGFHTAPVVDADPDADVPWLATAYVPGPTLSGLLAERGPMDEDRLRLLGAALAEALHAVHACGLVHRDLKPGNIIMAEDGPRVLDFGIARAVESTRLTFTGAAFGTPGFLAPEQAQGLDVSGAADVFALGAVLVAAAGGSAFGEGTPLGLMYRSVHEPADVSAVPEGLRAAVAACLVKDPARRPSPEELLERFAPGPVVSDSGPTVPVDVPVRTAPLVPDTVVAPAEQEQGQGREPGPERSVRGGGGRSRVVTVLAGTVVAVVAAVLVVVASRGDDPGGEAGALRSPSASPPASSSASPAASASRQASAAPPAGRDAAAAAPGDAPGDRVTVVVSARESSWLSVKDHGGRLVFDGTIQPGESKTFTDGQSIDLVLGDAGAVDLVVNGKEIADDFQSGQVERLTYTKDDPVRG